VKVIIAGSRSITDITVVAAAISCSGYQLNEVVSGTARGVDRLGEQYAQLHNIPVVRFPADWDRYGRSAGYRRNEEMARYADALVAVWDGVSRGTQHMIDIARRAGLKVFVYQGDSQCLTASPTNQPSTKTG
jgi:glycerophosphoryl diester phosphodiesterase